MNKFANVATFEIEPGEKETFLPLLKAHAERCLNGESGTLQFDLLEPINEDKQVMVYEVYQDEAAFGKHWNGPYVEQIIQETSGMVKNVSGIRCTIID